MGLAGVKSRETGEPVLPEPLPYEGRPGYRQITLEDWKRLRAEFLEKRRKGTTAEQRLNEPSKKACDRGG